MKDQLIKEYISAEKDPKVMVLFGGNPFRRNEVIQKLKNLRKVTIYGTLSEEEGMAKLKTLEKVDLVLIGGRYTDFERKRIHAYIKSNMPETEITEPGFDYAYSNDAIFEDVKMKIG